MKVLPLVALLVTLMAGTAAAAIIRPTFAEQETFKTGPGPISILSDDFDFDGNEDIVTANRFEDGNPDNGDGDISFLKGKPNGTFQQPPKSFEVSVSATFVLSGDFNDDNILDIALTDPDCSEAEGCVVILLGDGLGDFTESDNLPSGGALPFELTRADFDRDGNQDLAVANTLSDNIQILEGNGDGAFTKGQTVPTGDETFPRSVQRGDFDGDRDQDLLVANAGTNRVVLLENRSGTFRRTTSVAVGSSPVNVVIDDLNDDRKLDFATANADSDDVSVRLGRGDGTFASRGEFPSGGSQPFSLAVADYNGDGKLDLAAANNLGEDPAVEDTGNVGVLSGRGDGTFKNARRFDVGDGPAAITTGTFNRNDAKPDLATANFGDDDQNTVDSVSILINTTESAS